MYLFYAHLDSVGSVRIDNVHAGLEKHSAVSNQHSARKRYHQGGSNARMVGMSDHVPCFEPRSASKNVFLAEC